MSNSHFPTKSKRERRSPFATNWPAILRNAPIDTSASSNFGRHRPSHSCSRIQIQDHRQIEPSLGRGNGCDICDPFGIRFCCRKLPIEDLGSNRVSSVSFGSQHPTAFASGTHLRLAHEPGNPFARNPPPVVFDLPVDPRGTISALVPFKDRPNLLSKLSITRVGASWQNACARHTIRFRKRQVPGT